MSKAFGETVALRNVDFDAAPGEIVAVMGASGSGKSTLLHCLAGILTPDEGEIHFAGRRLDRLAESDRCALRRTSFGFVFQFGQLIPELTALENAALPLLLRGERRRLAFATAREWLDRVGIGELADRHPPDMSGGQSQRVGLARAFVIEPQVIFADEPTGALDSAASESVMSLMRKTAEAQAATIVLVTHDATVARHAHRRVAMSDGRIVGPAKAP